MKKEKCTQVQSKFTTLILRSRFKFDQYKHWHTIVIWVRNLWKPPRGNILFWCQGFFIQVFHITTLSIIHKRKVGKIKEYSYNSANWLNLLSKYDDFNKNKIKSSKSGNFGSFFSTKILCMTHTGFFFLSPSEKEFEKNNSGWYHIYVFFNHQKLFLGVFPTSKGLWFSYRLEGILVSSMIQTT